MSPVATVLLISGDARTVEHCQATLTFEPGVRLLATRHPAEAVIIAREARPDLVVVDHALAGGEVFDLCRRLRAQPDMEDAMIVLLAGPGAPELKVAGLAFGVDEFLARPVEAADLLAKVRWTQRLRRVNDEIRSDRHELERLHVALARGFDHLLELLVTLLDMRLPGAAARGERAAELARALAERFEIAPGLQRDLDIAARLHEMGRVIGPELEADTEAYLGGGHDTRYVLATRALLQRVDGLHDVAELVGAIYESWDGTGGPDRLQRGQIPLRARILRVVIDFVTALAAADAPPFDVILEDLAERGGTWYDPMVVVQLREHLAGGSAAELRASRLRVLIPDLQVGMVLAEDLCTDSGLKLLARGTRISPSALEIIQRRHRIQPILEGAAILRESA